MAYCKFPLISVVNTYANNLQDIAPTYYNLDDFAKGEIRTALMRTADKVRRKQAMKREK